MPRALLPLLLLFAVACVELEATPGTSCKSSDDCEEFHYCDAGSCLPDPLTPEQRCEEQGPCTTEALEDGTPLTCGAEYCPDSGVEGETICTPTGCCTAVCAGDAPCGGQDSCGRPVCLDGCPDWVPIQAGGDPGERAFVGLALEPAGAGTQPAIILTGGLGTTERGQDRDFQGTWELQLKEPLAWGQLQTAADDDVPRVFGAATLVPPRGKVVSVGGLFLGGGSTNDLWELQHESAAAGATWLAIPPEGVSPWREVGRGAACVAYDELRGEVVLFGGDLQSTPDTFLGDTWVWTDSAGGATAHWEERTDPAGPSARRWASCSWDGEGVVLFGGEDANGFSNETWRWNGVRWARLDPANGAAAPGVLKTHSMVWDPTGQRAILFGGDSGVALVQETWEWKRPEGAAEHRWLLYPDESTIGARAGVGLVAIPPGLATGTPLDAGGVLLFGGRRSQRGYSGDLWFLPGR